MLPTHGGWQGPHQQGHYVAEGVVNKLAKYRAVLLAAATTQSAQHSYNCCSPWFCRGATCSPARQPGCGLFGEPGAEKLGLRTASYYDYL